MEPDSFFLPWNGVLSDKECSMAVHDKYVSVHHLCRFSCDSDNDLANRGSCVGHLFSLSTTCLPVIGSLCHTWHIALMFVITLCPQVPVKVLEGNIFYVMGKTQLGLVWKPNRTIWRKINLCETVIMYQWFSFTEPVGALKCKHEMCRYRFFVLSTGATVLFRS